MGSVSILPNIAESVERMRRHGRTTPKGKAVTMMSLDAAKSLARSLNVDLMLDAHGRQLIGGFLIEIVNETNIIDTNGY